MQGFRTCIATSCSYFYEYFKSREKEEKNKD